MIQNFPLFLALISASSTAFLGMLVLFHNRRSATNVIFLVHALVGTILSILHYFSITEGNVLFWVRLVIFFAVPHVFLFYVFVINFPSETLALSKRLLWFLGAVMGVMMLLSLSPFVFIGTVFFHNQVVPVAGPLMPIFAPELLFVDCLCQL